MNFPNAIKSFFVKYVTFSGRASRSEYWYAILFLALGSYCLEFIEGTLGLFPNSENYVLDGIFRMATLIPMIAVTIRRLHDVGRSGWYSLIALTGIGVIVLVVWACMAGEPSDNPHGPNPLALPPPMPK